jgi:hypothetical protein
MNWLASKTLANELRQQSGKEGKFSPHRKGWKHLHADVSCGLLQPIVSGVLGTPRVRVVSWTDWIRKVSPLRLNNFVFSSSTEGREATQHSDLLVQRISNHQISPCSSSTKCHGELALPMKSAG